MNYPAHLQFTRQQIAELTGISDEVLAFWLKQQLLVAKDEPISGRGRHKRFGFVQIHIAAILNQLRNFGVNISGLRSVSEILQAAVKTGERVLSDEIDPETFCDATHLENMLQEYKQGQTRHGRIVARNWSEFNSFDDWFANYIQDNSFRRTLNDSIALFKTLKPGEGRLLELYKGLTDPEHFRRGPDSGDGWAEHVFSIAPGPDGDWAIVQYDDDPSSSLKERMAEPVSYISVRVSKLVRDIWQPKKSRTVS